VGHSSRFDNCTLLNPIFVPDITFCGKQSTATQNPGNTWLNKQNGIGDWAGNSYVTSGCPGTCEERLLEPSNFVVCSDQAVMSHTSDGSNLVQNTTWVINHLKVYKKQLLNGQIGDTGSSVSLFTPSTFTSISCSLLLFGIAACLLKVHLS